MAAMRPHVEEILKKYKDVDCISSAPSQKHRSIQVVDYINSQISKGPTADLNVRMGWIKDRNKLELFIAVHTTTTTLEWVERNGSFQF